MTFHRTESHALFYLTLAAPLLAAGVARLHGEMALFKRWWLAIWLALVTHPLLDVMTIYGTQLGLPFTDWPYGVGSIFIIDPAYTLPLLVCSGVALALRSGPRALRWNAAGLVLSTSYLAWSVLAQQLATRAAEVALKAQGKSVQRLLVTPTPFNTLLWRVVAITPQGYSEGFHSLLDDNRPMVFDDYPRGEALFAQFSSQWPVARMVWFTHGFIKISLRGDQALVTDLRMGQEPWYSFNFVVARQASGQWREVPPELISERPEIGPSLSWLWRRLRGERLPPPR